MAETTISNTPPATTMSDHLLRQRRNLIIVCGILWFNKYARVTLPTSIDFSGAHLVIGNSGALLNTLWLVFAYFLYRYFQYFYTEGMASLRAARDEALEKKCAPIIRAKVDEAYPKERIEHYSGYKQLKSNGWIYDGQTMGGGLTLYPITGPVIKRSMLWREIAQAYFQTFIVNNAGTDYILPFLLAAFVVLYYSWGMI